MKYAVVHAHFKMSFSVMEVFSGNRFSFGFILPNATAGEYSHSCEPRTEGCQVMAG